MKKKIALITLTLLTTIVFGQTECTNGLAGNFPCSNYDLMSVLTLNDMDADSGNDSWGWTDPDTGKEYALMGLNNGTAFVDISDPLNLIYLGKLPTHNGFLDFGAIWRDIKVFNNHAFIVSEIQNHGMQVFDLKRLRNVTNPPLTFDEDAHYDNFGDAHNIAINEATGFAYVVGSQTFSGGGHYIDINDPINPIAAGGTSQNGYTHDAQIVMYNGPDIEHVGKEIYLGSNTDEIVIFDVTNKSNPVLISSTSYAQEAYTHQGWLTEDQTYFLVNDEADEVAFGFNTRTLVFDLTDLDNPFFKFEYQGPTSATDHNLYVYEDRAYLANYSEGLRVIDISDIENENITEVGSFDTFPGNNSAGTDNGIWNVYPFFESRNIFLSDYNRGLFIVRESGTLNIPDTTAENNFSLYPNPANTLVTIKTELGTIQKIEIFNLLGQQVQNINSNAVASVTLDINNLTKGVYLIKVNEDTVLKLIKE